MFFRFGAPYRKIEEKRGVTVTDTGFPEVRPTPAVVAHQAEARQKAIMTTPSTSSKKNPSWDEDWVSTRNEPPVSAQSFTPNSSFTQPAMPNHPNQVASTNLQSSSSAVSSQ